MNLEFIKNEPCHFSEMARDKASKFFRYNLWRKGFQMWCFLNFWELPKPQNGMSIFGRKLWKMNIIFWVPGSTQELKIYGIWKPWHQRAYNEQKFKALWLAIPEKFSSICIVRTFLSAWSYQSRQKAVNYYHCRIPWALPNCEISSCIACSSKTS
jgi:hypothetical protein